LIVLTTIASAVFITASLLLAGISPSLRTCPTDERKELGVFCVADNSRISRGNSTFFSKITNTYRDKGIQAFQQGNYPEATTLFQQAVEADKNDPEVLIYYNNSLAREQGSPLTLAVVVGVEEGKIEKPKAQEILHGVAKAQNQLKEKNGFNGRLLEIVIANDANDLQQAKQVAQEIVKDSPILGVVGQNYTEAELPEYKKAGLKIIFLTSPTKNSTINHAYDATYAFIKALSSSGNPTRTTVLEKLKQ
jgi:branched-chain amino acid transport system substrate-binding protein